MDERHFEIRVENSPTILSKIVQVIKRRRINIKRLLAYEEKDDRSLAKIEIILETDAEKARLIKTQLVKLVDVISII